MNIAHICLPTLSVLYWQGGAVRQHTRELAVQQVKLGHTVSLYSIGDETKSIDYNGLAIHFIHCQLRGFPKVYEYQLKLSTHLKQQSPTLTSLNVNTQKGRAVVDPPVQDFPDL